MEIKGKQKIIDKYYKYLNPKVLWSIIGVLMIVVISASLAWFRLLQEVDSVQMCRGSEVRGFCIPAANNSDLKSTISDWKTYTDDYYGFQFKYPPTLKIENPPPMIGVVVGNLGIHIYGRNSDEIQQNIKIDQYWERLYSGATKPKDSERQTIMIDGHQAYRWESVKAYSGDYPIATYVVVNNNSNELIEFIYQQDKDPELNKSDFNVLLSTFKFIK